MIEIPDYWLTFVIATVLPALVALITKKCRSSAFKGVLLAAVSAVAGVATSVQVAGGELEWKTALTSAIITFVTATATHYGLLKPTGVTGTDGAIATAVPGGLGQEVPNPENSHELGL